MLVKAVVLLDGISSIIHTENREMLDFFFEKVGEKNCELEKKYFFCRRIFLKFLWNLSLPQNAVNPNFQTIRANIRETVQLSILIPPPPSAGVSQYTSSYEDGF